MLRNLLGTIFSSFQLGNNGPKWKAESPGIKALTSTDSAEQVGAASYAYTYNSENLAISHPTTMIDPVIGDITIEAELLLL